MLGKHREAAIVLCSRDGHKPVDDFLLEHQHHVGDVARRVEPANEQGGRHIVRQIGDDPAWCCAEVKGLDLQGIGFDKIESPPRRGLQLEQGPERPGIDLDRHDAGSAFQQEGARETSGPRADLDNGSLAERCRGAGNAPREVQVEQEVLAEALPGIETVCCDRFPQGRQGLDGVHAQAPRRRAMSSAMSMAARRLAGSA